MRRRKTPHVLMRNPGRQLGVILLAWSLPLLALAAPLPQIGGGLQDTNGYNGATVLPTTNNWIALIGTAVNLILGLCGIVLVIYIVYAGILYMQSGFNAESVKKAKRMLVTAVIGILIIAAAYAITNFVFGLVTAAVLSPT